MQSLVAVDFCIRVVSIASPPSRDTILTIRCRLITLHSSNTVDSGWQPYFNLGNFGKCSTYRHVPHAFLLYLAPALRRRLALTSMVASDRHVFRKGGKVFLSNRVVLGHGSSPKDADRKSPRLLQADWLAR